MVENMCTRYGEPVATIVTPNDDVNGEAADSKCYYAFPEIEALVDQGTALEADLRALGFGYRAAYIAKTAQQLKVSIHGLCITLICLKHSARPYFPTKASQPLLM